MDGEGLEFEDMLEYVYRLECIYRDYAHRLELQSGRGCAGVMIMILMI